MTGLIILIIAALIGALVVFGIRMFQIEVVPVAAQANEENNPDADASGEGGEAEADGEENAEAAEDEEPAEMVDLFDYFNEAQEEADAESIASSVEKDGDSRIDKLTDFKTGRKYLVECKKLLETAKEENHVYCAISLDLDRFCYINNLKGAATGDYVLTQLSQQLRRILPEGAEVTRISCDHFAGVFPLVDIALFEDYYEQLRRACEKIRNDIAAKTGFKLSVGFAMTDNDASYDVSVLITRANIARHSAKVTKAEKYEIYDETMLSSFFYGESMMDDYSECQYGDDFAIYFETQVDLKKDKIIGCDTLVRWAYDDKGNEMITQETGYIPTNNDKVIYHVCRIMSRWRKAAREALPVFVYVPVTDLFKTDIDEFLSKCCSEFQIEPSTLVLKIDVSVVRVDWSMCSKQFKKIHDIGVKICIIGMDTGYANLDFLNGLSVNYIKFHKSFAHNVEKSPEQLDKCKKIIERVKQMGAEISFEGVDNTDQMSALKSIHAKIVQGRYTGRPSTADELQRLLPEHVERRAGEQTVILDEAQLAKGDWTLF